MAAQLITDLWIDGYGAQAASGKVFFYQPKTLTPVNVFQDDAASIVLTQPVSIDANGRTVFPVYTTAPVRMILQNAQGATLQDVERANGIRAEITSLVNTSWPNELTVDAAFTALATSLGGKDGSFLANGTGAVSRSMQSSLSEARLSVKNFGAKGNGTTDDTAAIINAITYANSLGGAEVFFPAGTYPISAQLSLSTSGVSLKGTGSTSSVISNAQASTGAITCSASRFYIEDLGIAASPGSTAAAITLTQLDGASPPQGYGSFRRVRVTGHRTCVVVAGRKHSFEGCEMITDGNSASICYSLGASAATGTSIRGGACDAAAGAGISVGSGIGIQFIGSGAVNATVIDGVYIISATTSINIDTTATKTSGVAVIGCEFGFDVGNITIGANAGNASTNGKVFFMEYGNVIDGGGSSLFQITDNTSGGSNSYGTATGGRDLGGELGTSLTLANTNAVTPALNNASRYYYKYTGINGGSVTVNAPTGYNTGASFSGKMLTMIFDNQGAGTVTFTLDAIYRKSAAVAPSNLHAVTVTFIYENDITKWCEHSRSAEF